MLTGRENKWGEKSERMNKGENKEKWMLGNSHPATQPWNKSESKIHRRKGKFPEGKGKWDNLRKVC